MRDCPKCGKRHNRKTLMCNRCYTTQPGQLEKRKARDRRYYKKLSAKWREERSKLICQRCGEEFKGNKSNQKHCCITCQQGLKTRVERGVSDCIVCGKEFRQMRRDSKCCSPRCVRKWEYRKRNKAKKLFYERTREHRIRASGGKFTFAQWVCVKKKYNFTCPRCGRNEPKISLTIDHIVPISLGGIHDITNIQPLCRRCNTSKGNHYIKQYAYYNNQVL